MQKNQKQIFLKSKILKKKFPLSSERATFLQKIEEKSDYEQEILCRLLIEGELRLNRIEEARITACNKARKNGKKLLKDSKQVLRNAEKEENEASAKSALQQLNDI